MKPAAGQIIVSFKAKSLTASVSHTIILQDGGLNHKQILEIYKEY